TVLWHTWNPLLLTPAVSKGLSAPIKLFREGSITMEVSDGSPPVRIGADAAGKYDCGDRRANMAIGLAWDPNGRMAVLTLGEGDPVPAPLTGPDDTVPWQYCPVAVPTTIPNVAINEWGLTPVYAPFPPTELFDPSLGKQIILGKRVFDLTPPRP